MSYGALGRAVERLRETSTTEDEYPPLTRFTSAVVESRLAYRDWRGLPAVVGASRLIASTIDQLPIVTTRGDVPTWLRRPRRYGGALDQGDLVQYLVQSMLWQGMGALACTRIGDSWRLDAVRPDAVAVMSDPGGAVVSLSWLLAGKPIDPVPASPDDAVQGRRYLLPIPYTITPRYPGGVSPLRQAQTSLEGFAGTEAATFQNFDNGTYSGGRLETDQDVTPTTAERYQRRWMQNRQDGTIPVLGSGFRYVNDLINPRDAQWIEARAFNQATVYMLLGIPPAYMGASLVGGQSSLAYANAQDNARLFRRNCLGAFTTQIEDALSLLMPPGRSAAEETRVAFDYSEWEETGGTDAGQDPDA